VAPWSSSSSSTNSSQATSSGGTNAWLSGEAGVLSDVAARTPTDVLNKRVVREIAELASREVPHKRGSGPGPNDSGFFLQTAADGSVALWLGAGDMNAHLAAVKAGKLAPEKPSTLHVDGFDPPFRVVSVKMANGSQIYLGLSERD
jgi:hypothetical protein